MAQFLSLFFFSFPLFSLDRMTDPRAISNHVSPIRVNDFFFSDVLADNEGIYLRRIISNSDKVRKSVRPTGSHTSPDK